MAMTRQALLEYAVAEYGDLADQAKLQASTDTAGGWKSILDDVFRTLGTDESALTSTTITDAQTPSALALLEFFTLRRTLRALATKQSDSAGATGTRVVNGRWTQIYAQYNDRMEEAKARVVAMGYGRAAGILRAPSITAIPNRVLSSTGY